MSAFEYKEYSVLMSVYHKERPEYLKQAIESIQVQSLSTNDFVLVCDGPLNDELDAVIQTKQLEMGENLNVVRLAKNGGLGNALNESIKHCKNELVARMDSDDIAYPDRCEKQIAVFNTHSEVSIALMFDYPWGGRKALSKVGFYAHELWLDVFDSAGIIPFVLIWIVTIQITFSNLKYILNKKVPIENRVLITGITASVTVQFFFEPVLTGCRALLFSYLLICGIIRSQLSQY